MKPPAAPAPDQRSADDLALELVRVLARSLAREHHRAAEQARQTKAE